MRWFRRTGSQGEKVIASEVHGHVFQVSDVAGDVNIVVTEAASPRMARSGYRQSVLRMAPDVLTGRRAELDELADFAVAPTGDTYSWWCAPAWAGKTALLSAFVLNPPPQVRVVSFFVTTRYGGQADRFSFASALFEQLSDMLDVPVPDTLNDATREAQLWTMIERAAAQCQEQGRRLVLVVDGLDEDRGVTEGPDNHSIAALLPRRPPYGMRVIVSGRPNPPLPDDVPDDHPIRDPAIVRLLDASPAAQVRRDDMTRELKFLLHGPDLGRDMLGLLTAAAGELSSRDLTELTGSAPWELNDHLRAVSGRSYRQQQARWRTDDTVYVLGHEQLQAAVVDAFGDQMSRFHDRLHQWAADYRDRGWPEDTPEYLLHGYFDMAAASGARDAVIACAGDRLRHARMLATTGGDSPALGEIDTASALLLTAKPSDYATMGWLAVHRRELTDQNQDMPTRLPGLRARLGQDLRAETMALAITDRSDRDSALLDLIDLALGDEYLSYAKSLALRLTDQASQRAAAAFARHFASTGATTEAIATARSITDASIRNEALSRIAVLLVDDACVQSVVALITDPQATTNCRIEIIGRLSGPSRAAHLGAVMESLAKDPADRNENYRREKAMSRLAVTLARAGDHSTAERLVQSISLTSVRAEAVALMASATTDAERAVGWAAASARMLPEIENDQARLRVMLTLARAVVLLPEGRAWATTLLEEAVQTIAAANYTEQMKDQEYAAVCRTYAELGDLEAAWALGRQIHHFGQQASALRALAIRIAERGDVLRAMAVAESIYDERLRADALTEVGIALIRSSHPDEAAAVADRAEALARSIIDVSDHSELLASLAGALHQTGQHEAAVRILDRAESLVCRPPTDWVTYNYEASALASLSAATATLEDPLRADRLAQRLNQICSNAQTIRADYYAWDIASYVGTVATFGSIERAQQIIESLAEEEQRTRSLVVLAECVARRGDPGAAIDIAEGIVFRWLRLQALNDVAAGLCEAGLVADARSVFVHAYRIAAEEQKPTERVNALAVILPTARRIGPPEEADRIGEELIAAVRQIPDQSRRLTVIAELLQEQPLVTQSAWVAIVLDEAEKAAAQIDAASVRPQDWALLLGVACTVRDLNRTARFVPRVRQVLADSTDWRIRPAAWVALAKAAAVRNDSAELTAVLAHLSNETKRVRTEFWLLDENDAAGLDRLAMRALSLGVWDVAIAALQLAEPSALVTIAHALMEIGPFPDGGVD